MGRKGCGKGAFCRATQGGGYQCRCRTKAGYSGTPVKNAKATCTFNPTLRDIDFISGSVGETTSANKPSLTCVGWSCGADSAWLQIKTVKCQNNGRNDEGDFGFRCTANMPKGCKFDEQLLAVDCDFTDEEMTVVKAGSCRVEYGLECGRLQEGIEAHRKMEQAVAAQRRIQESTKDEELARIELLKLQELESNEKVAAAQLAQIERIELSAKRAADSQAAQGTRALDSLQADALQKLFAAQTSFNRAEQQLREQHDQAKAARSEDFARQKEKRMEDKACRIALARDPFKTGDKVELTLRPEQEAQVLKAYCVGDKSKPSVVHTIQILSSSEIIEQVYADTLKVWVALDFGQDNGQFDHPGGARRPSGEPVELTPEQFMFAVIVGGVILVVLLVVMGPKKLLESLAKASKVKPFLAQGTTVKAEREQSGWIAGVRAFFNFKKSVYEGTVVRNVLSSAAAMRGFDVQFSDGIEKIKLSAVKGFKLPGQSRFQPLHHLRVGRNQLRELEQARLLAEKIKQGMIEAREIERESQVEEANLATLQQELEAWYEAELTSRLAQEQIKFDVHTAAAQAEAGERRETLKAKLAKERDEMQKAFSRDLEGARAKVKAAWEKHIADQKSRRHAAEQDYKARMDQLQRSIGSDQAKTQELRQSLDRKMEMYEAVGFTVFEQ